ncbi:MAG TPA: DUF2306 domain-containing protein [Terriglobales bacterium]|nr:DUF2306 domain-containing protein [Terriglobales bacterium]
MGAKRRANWWALLFAIPAAFVVYALVPYVGFNPEKSRIPLPQDIREYYPMLVMHVMFASIAMLTACAQIWPWFRRRYPAAHRILGRVYVFGGVIPAGVAGMFIGAVGPFGPVLRASDILLAVLWLSFAITGFVSGYQRRYGNHRRWMIRSVALTFSIITNRIWGVVLTLAFAPLLPTLFGGSEVAMVQAIAGLSGWLGWILPLLFVEWWLVERSGTPTMQRAQALESAIKI